MLFNKFLKRYLTIGAAAGNYFGISGITIDKIITTMTETPTEIKQTFF